MHVSQEEAVAHIQALLEAKQERVRQGPGWPGAEKSLNPAHDEHLTAPAQGGVHDETTHDRIRAHERGDQSKRGRS